MDAFLAPLGLILVMAAGTAQMNFDNVHFACATPDELPIAVEVVNEAMYMVEDEHAVESADLGDVPEETYWCGLINYPVDFSKAQRLDESYDVYVVSEDEWLPTYQVMIGDQPVYLTAQLPFDRHALEGQGPIPVWVAEEPATLERMHRFDASMKALAATN
jgi:hypothetical protein